MVLVVLSQRQYLGGPYEGRLAEDLELLLVASQNHVVALGAHFAPARLAPALPATIHPAVRTWLATSTFQKSTRTWLATPASVPALSPAPRAESRDGGRIQPPPSLPFPLPLTLLYC